MRSIRAWGMRIVGTFRSERRDAEFTAELESHIAMHVEEKVRTGMTAEEARRDALVPRIERQIPGTSLTASALNQHGELVWPTLISNGNIQLNFTVTISRKPEKNPENSALNM